MSKLSFLLIQLLICLSCAHHTNYEKPSLIFINDTWILFQNHKISQDSLLKGFTHQLYENPIDNDGTLLIQSKIDKLDSMSQMKFYLDNIYVQLYTDSYERLNPPPKIRLPDPDSSLVTYYVSIIASRSYNTDSVITYIINDKLSSCELKEPIIRFYVKLMRILKKNNISNILDSVSAKNDTCSHKNAELLKHSFKYIL